MSWITGVRARLRALVDRASAEKRMEEEIVFHTEMETEKNLRAGMSPEEARRRARIAFGAIEAHKAELRDGRRLVLLEDLGYDVRYAARSLRRDALWTTLAVLIVGLGIGASVTVFSLVHALLLRPLPFHQPEQLVWIANGASEHLPSLEEDLSARTVQVTHLQTLQRASRTVADVAGFSPFYGDKEMALRAALGAGRGRLVQQLLTESLLLSGGGAVLGLLLAVGGTHLLAHTDALSLPLLDHVRVDWTVFGFAAVIALLTGLLFGLAPALRAAVPAVDQPLKTVSRGSSAGRRHGRIRAALVVSEVGLACVLLVGAGLLTRSFLHVLDVDLGFRPEGAVAVRIDPSFLFSSQPLRTAYYDKALRHARAAPGIRAAGLTDALPLGWTRQWSVTAPGQNDPPDGGRQVFVRIVSEGYLRSMGVPLRAGRDFTAGDNASSRPVVIINETFAQTLWPDEGPLGRMLSAGTDAAGRREEREVIGVVAGTRHQTLEKEPGSELYIPLRQTGDYDAVHIVVRGALTPEGLTSAVRSALRPVNPTLPMTEVRVIQDLVDRSVSPRRLIVLLLMGFAGFALVLAALGIFGVISYGVTQRKREIGIRIALGASTGALQRRILWQTMKLAAAGTALGLLAAYAVARVIQSQLFGVTFADPVIFSAAMIVLTTAAVLAGYLPARRASHVNPVEALRAE
jgi:predicted permease